MEFERTTRRSPKIGLTSLIDVVFLLVVFFMLTTSFTVQKNLAISYAVEGEEPDKKADPIVVNIHKNQNYTINERAIPLAEFTSEVAQLISKFGANVEILIISDQGTTAQDMITTIDYLQHGGANNFVFVDTNNTEQGL